MTTSNLLKEKTSYDPSKLENKVLLDDHRITHAWWSTILRGTKIKGWSKEDVYNAHQLIAKEIEKRGYKHNSPLPETLDELSYDQPFPAWKRDGEDGIKGDELELNNILNAFEGDMMLSEDFVSIVGGLCNHGQTKGDIDILIKAPEPHEEGAPEGMATKFRISRALAKLGIPEERIQYLYDDFHGPFTSHVHLFDLVLKLKPKALHEMQEELAKKQITPFKFFIQPKPVHGRYKEEVYSPDTVVEVIKNLKRWNDQLPNGIFVERKFDGVRCQVHKVNKTIKIITEDGGDLTNKIPTLRNQFLKIPHNFVAEFELELWLDNKHQSRSDTAGEIHLKGISKNESSMIANLYDCLWFDDKDIHSLEFSERVQFLSKLGEDKNIKQSEKRLVKNFDELKKTVNYFSKIEGSEGAMLKLPFYKYPLEHNTYEMMKFKNEFSLNVEVVEKHDVKESNSFNYLTIVRDGKEKIPAGRTYNTLINIPVGGFLKVAFVNLNKYTDSKTGKVWFNMWAPRPLEKANSVDSIETAEKISIKSGGEISSKSFPSRYENLDFNEDRISDFKRSCIIENSEEFNYSLYNNWISKEEFIPEILSTADVIRNRSNFILRRDLSDSSLVLLRDQNNKIKKEVVVELMKN